MNLEELSHFGYFVDVTVPVWRICPSLIWILVPNTSHVLQLRPSKSYGVGGILNLTFRDLGLGLWIGSWPQACQFHGRVHIKCNSS